LVERTFAVLALMGTGVAAGVLVAVELSIVPAFLALTPERYVETHKLVGRYFDRVMPLLVLATVGVDISLAVWARGGAALAFGAAAVLLICVGAVSQFGNVPINRRVKALAAGPVPVGWTDPRRSWGRLHLVRTMFAVSALVMAGAGALSTY
jgi:uncharacterized membrane protein